MNLWTFLSQFGAVPLMMMMVQATCASESEQQNLTCSVRRLPDNTFKYQLSRVLWTSGCSPRWETEDDINLAMDLDFDPTRVVSVTNSYIRLKNCTNNLRFRWECGQFREQVNCSFDCSAPAPWGDLQPTTVNTTQICFSEGHCVEQLIVFSAVGVISIIMLAAIVGVIVKKVYNKCKKESIEESLGHKAEDGGIELGERLIENKV